MIKQTFSLATVFLLAVNVFATPLNQNPAFARQQNSGISFTENKGQVHDQNYKPRPDVLYGAMAGNMSLHIKNTGLSYQLHKANEDEELKTASFANVPGTKEKLEPPSEQIIYRIDLNWLNHNVNFTQTTGEARSGYNNYYMENCPDGLLNVRSYKSVTLINLYNGINLHYYEKNGELKHDYIVAPYVDYKQIQLQVSGAEVSVNKDGSLLLSTPLGKIQEGAPIVYQNNKQLNARWQIKNNVLSFEIENYNPGYELIIDPVTRLWGTYYGGTGTDNGQSCATDATGNVYLAGYTNSSTSTLIATVGSHQNTFGGDWDACLVKFDADGIRQWSTYYGGSSEDAGLSCATDASGNVYLAGHTNAYLPNTLIATVGSHQPVSNNYDSYNYDAFLVKFNKNGVRQWGTFYGGSNDDRGYSCTTDASGNVYLAGFTESGIGTFVASQGSHQFVFGGGEDAFLVKFNPNGVRQWGTYYGGAGYDRGYSCDTDAFGNVYLAGYTTSSTGTRIATMASHQSTYGGFPNDAFLVKFNSNGGRQWGTYYGGSGEDIGLSCATDASGNVYLAGNAATPTGTIIATAGSHQSAIVGNSDSFLAKFDGTGVRQWATYYYGVYGYCATDAYGNVYLAGSIAINNGTLTVTNGCYQTVLGGGIDAYLVKFDVNGIRQWGTFYGGAGGDDGYFCTTDVAGNIYLAGRSESINGTAIASGGSHQSIYGGGAWDSYLVKFDVCDVAPAQPLAINGAVACAGLATSYSTTITFGASSYTWSLPPGWSGFENTNVISATPGSSGVFTVIAGNACGVSPQQTLNVTVYTSPTVTVNSGSVCAGQSFTILANGAATYTYSGGQVVSPLITSSYSVTGTNAAGCKSSAVSTITVNPLPGINVSTNNALLCSGESATLTATGTSSTYTFNPGGPGPISIVSPTVTSTYTITGTGSNGCNNTVIITQNVGACTGIQGNNFADVGISIYPNPTEGIFNMELDSDNEVVIMNAIGQTVSSFQLRSGKHQINIEGLAKGVYVLKFVSARDSNNLKVIKE